MKKVSKKKVRKFLAKVLVLILAHAGMIAMLLYGFEHMTVYR